MDHIDIHPGFNQNVHDFNELYGNIPMSDIQICSKMSSTDRVFTAIYKGKMVAVKTHPFNNIADVRIFVEETQVLLQLTHANILITLGYVYSVKNCLLMTEIATLTLDEYLRIKHNQYDNDIDTYRLKIVIGIAKGLNYIHSKDIIHRRLRSDTILLDNDINPKLTGFGLARSRKSATSQLVFTMNSYRWTAPEVLGRRYTAEPASDIYSFGMIIWETFTKKYPYQEIRDEIQVRKLIEAKMHVRIFPEWPAEWKDIIEKCWKVPSERVATHTLLNILQNFRIDREIPMGDLNSMIVSPINLRSSILFIPPQILEQDEYFSKLYTTHREIYGRYKITKPQNTTAFEFRKCRGQKFMMVPNLIKIKSEKIQHLSPDFTLPKDLSLSALVHLFKNAKIMQNAWKESGRQGFLYFKIPHIWVFVFIHNKQSYHLIAYQSNKCHHDFYFLRIISDLDLSQKKDYAGFLAAWEVAFVLCSQNDPITQDFYKNLVKPIN